MVNPIVSFTVTPTSIEKGSSAVLGWATVGAAEVRIDGYVVALSGTKTVSPTVTTTYRLGAWNIIEGWYYQNVTLTVTIPPGPEPEPEPEPEQPPSGETPYITVAGFKNYTDPARYCAYVKCSWNETHIAECFEYKTTTNPYAPYTETEAINKALAVSKLYEDEILQPCPFAHTTQPPVLPPPEPPGGGDIPGWEDFLTDPLGTVMTLILIGLEALWGFTVGTVGTVIDWIYQFTALLTTEFYKFLEDPIDYITNIVGGVVDSVTGWFGEQWDNITSFWDDVTDKIGSWWGGVVDDFNSWIANAIPEFIDFLGGVWDNTGSWLGGLFEGFLGIVGYQLDQLHINISYEWKEGDAEIVKKQQDEYLSKDTGKNIIFNWFLEWVVSWFTEQINDFNKGLEEEYSRMEEEEG